MKSLITFIFLLLFVSLGSAQKKKLVLNLTRDATYNQLMVSNTSITQSIQEQDIKINMEISGRMSFKVIGIENSVYAMDVQYESLSMKMVMPGGAMEFSSEKKDDQDIFSKILSLMLRKPFQVQMTRTGKIQEVKNSEGLFDNVFEQFPQLPETQKAQIKSQLMQAYGDKAFKGNIEMETAIFPETEVAKGDTWLVKTQLESGMAAKIESTYQLIDVLDSFYQIHGNSIMETANKDAYVEANGMPVRYDLRGTMSSDIKADRNTGWIVEAKIIQKLDGTAYIKDNPKMPGGMTIPMSMASEMVITEK